MTSQLVFFALLVACFLVALAGGSAATAQQPTIDPDGVADRDSVSPLAQSLMRGDQDDAAGPQLHDKRGKCEVACKTLDGFSYCCSAGLTCNPYSYCVRESSGLSDGAIAGIVVGVVAGVCILLAAIGAGVWFFVIRKRQRMIKSSTASA